MPICPPTQTGRSPFCTSAAAAMTPWHQRRDKHRTILVMKVKASPGCSPGCCSEQTAGKKEFK